MTDVERESGHHGGTNAARAGASTPHAGADPAKPPVGLLLIDKPAKRAVSSVTACRRVKRSLRAAGFDVSKMRIGHAGTLDPLASGLLIVLVGRAATRLCDQLMNGPKTYVATLDLLKSSPSDDLETETTINTLLRRPTLKEIHDALDKFRGQIMQRPPAYSAIWIDGVRAFKLARKAATQHQRDGAGTEEQDGGEAGPARQSARDVLPEMAARPITIHALELLDFDWPRVTVRVNCSKGTYIRSLVRDLGTAITGHPAVLTELRRTAIGAFDVANAVALEQLPERITQADLLAIPEAAAR
jgi:tRNA pseudouridine55 synthase